MSTAHHHHALVSVTVACCAHNIRDAIRDALLVPLFPDGGQASRAKRVRLLPCAGGVNHGAGFDDGFAPIRIGDMQDKRRILPPVILHLVYIPAADGHHPCV